MPDPTPRAGPQARPHAATPFWSTTCVPDTLLAAIRHTWERLPADPYLRGGWRTRRLGRFRVEPQGLEPLSPIAVYQSKRANVLFGGLARTFAPLEDELASSPAFLALCQVFLAQLPAVAPDSVLWFHQLRVAVKDTSQGAAKPDPQGPHREERRFVGILPVATSGLEAGQTRLFAQPEASPSFERILPVGTLLAFDDAHFLHTTEPFARVSAPRAWRDIAIFALTDDELAGTVLDPRFPDAPP